MIAESCNSAEVLSRRERGIARKLLAKVGVFEVAKSVVHRMGRAYAARVCWDQYASQRFTGHNERPVEIAFTFKHLALLQPRTVLDVGTGTTALPHLMANCGCVVTAIDNVVDYWPRGMANRHWHVFNDDITASRLTRSFDFLSCISVLEHIGNHQAAVAEMFRLLTPGGCLVLTCPYSEEHYVPNVYSLSGSAYWDNSDFVCQSFSRAELDCWLESNRAVIVEQEFWQAWSGALWSLGTRLSPPRKVTREEEHQLTCLLLRKIG
jgi:SAM-dependent methyltransferase